MMGPRKAVVIPDFVILANIHTSLLIHLLKRRYDEHKI